MIFFQEVILKEWLSTRQLLIINISSIALLVFACFIFRNVFMNIIRNMIDVWIIVPYYKSDCIAFKLAFIMNLSLVVLCFMACLNGWVYAKYIFWTFGIKLNYPLPSTYMLSMVVLLLFVSGCAYCRMNASGWLFMAFSVILLIMTLLLVSGFSVYLLIISVPVRILLSALIISIVSQAIMTASLCPTRRRFIHSKVYHYVVLTFIGLLCFYMTACSLIANSVSASTSSSLIGG